MKKTYSNFATVIAVLAGMVLMYSFNAMAYGDGKAEEKTYKTDRTLIKEVIANQKRTHALLADIKGMLAQSK